MNKYMTVAEMQAIEFEANEQGLSYAEMMENAGSNLANWIHRKYNDCFPRAALALVGSGNNGGDALVALCRLIELGWHTDALIARQRPAQDHLVQQYLEMGGAVHPYPVGGTDLTLLEELLAKSPILIDGVLGTGIRLPLPPETAQLLGYVRQLVMGGHGKIHVIAVDCPSGVNSDNGETAVETIPAEVTYTMAGIKRGLMMFPAADLVGDIQVGEIGDLSGLRTWKAIKRGVLTDPDIFSCIPVRSRNVHKGTFGTALIVAGSGNYPGATLLSGEAAYRVGAGLVTIAVPELIYPAVVGTLREATWLRLPHTMGWINESAYQIVAENLVRASALAIGPGLGIDHSTKIFLSKIIGEKLPATVIDADGLKLLARIPDWFSTLADRVVLTPHPGEMMVLTGLDKEDIQRNRIEIAEAYAKKWNKVVVLKGAYTVIADSNNQSAIVPVATPALAKAGTGDVLTGMIVGFLAQGLDPFEAACMGAYLHARAGVAAGEVLGQTASVTAGNVIEMIPIILSRNQ